VIRKKYYIHKRCTKMGGSKITRKPNKKTRFLSRYQRTRLPKLGSPKNERIEKT
jgi:hypothetical protein